MNSKKPQNIGEYKKWLKDEHGIEISDRAQTHYDSVTSKIGRDLEKSDFWMQLTENVREYDGEYYLEKKAYHLLTSESMPELLIKPFDSFVLKTFRKNILENKRWPDDPEDGWILPNNWYTKI